MSTSAPKARRQVGRQGQNHVMKRNSKNRENCVFNHRMQAQRSKWKGFKPLVRMFCKGFQNRARNQFSIGIRKMSWCQVLCSMSVALHFPYQKLFKRNTTTKEECMPTCLLKPVQGPYGSKQIIWPRHVYGISFVLYSNIPRIRGSQLLIIQPNELRRLMQTVPGKMLIPKS